MADRRDLEGSPELSRIPRRRHNSRLEPTLAGARAAQPQVGPTGASGSNDREQTRGVSDSPRVPPCPYCGSQAVRVVSGLQSSTEIFLLILLAILFFPAALVYYLWLRSMPYCLSCKRRVSKRLWLAQ